MLLFAACQDSSMYMQYHTVDAKGWNSRDTLVFDLPEVESTSAFNVEYGLRVWRNYNYENFIMVAKLCDGKKVVSTDTISFAVYDKSGKQDGAGLNFIELTKPLNHQYTLKPKKKYKLKVTHIMMLDPLDGVGNVGVSIVSSDSSQRPFLRK